MVLTSDTLEISDNCIEYEIPFNIYSTLDTLKMKILANDYESEYIEFKTIALNVSDNVVVKLENNIYIVKTMKPYKYYDLPIASKTSLGGIIVGENLSISSNGVLSATGGGTVSGDYVTTDTTQDVTGAKTFKNVVKIQNGQGTGTLWLGGDVNANTLTNNKRHLARIVVPSYDDVTKGTTLLGFDSNTDSGLHVAGKSSDVVSFGGSKKITNATSPMALAFCVANTRGGMAATEKVYPLEMDASEARFNVQPNYNGVNLVTTNDAPTQSLTNLEIETLINSIV